MVNCALVVNMLHGAYSLPYMVCKFHIICLTAVVFCSVYMHLFALSFEDKHVFVVLLIVWILNVHAAYISKITYLLS